VWKSHVREACSKLARNVKSFQKFYPSFNQLPRQKLKHRHEVDDRSGYIFKILLKWLHQVLSICVHYDVILIVKKKNVALYLLTMCYFTQFYLVWNFNRKRRKRILCILLFIQKRWRSVNDFKRCKQDGVFFNEWFPWLKPRCVRPDHHASRWSLLMLKYFSLKIMALHAHTCKPNTAIFTEVFVVSSPWPRNDKPS